MIMERILTYPIGPAHAGKTIYQFLKEKQYARSVIIQLKKTENGILANGRWVHVNDRLQAGETLCVRLAENTPQNIQPACLPLSVVYEDDDLLVVNKPAGMPVHPSIAHSYDTLANAVCYYAQAKGEQYPYRCINRLDRDTSGLTVIAKHAYSSCILYRQMRLRQIRRTYYAIAQGKTHSYGTIDAPIARKEASVIERTVDFACGEHAVTHYETLSYLPASPQDIRLPPAGLSFLKLTLETGRTHQIRVHMRQIGHPLIGDFLYNPNDSSMSRQALHAGTLEFTHPVNGQPLRFTAQLPEDMLQFFHMVIS